MLAGSLWLVHPDSLRLAIDATTTETKAKKATEMRNWDEEWSRGIALLGQRCEVPMPPQRCRTLPPVPLFLSSVMDRNAFSGSWRGSLRYAVVYYDG